MKRIFNKIYLLALIGLVFGGCSKFEEINTDPTAATADQVQVQYFINQSLIKDQQNPGISERSFILYWVAAGRQITDADGGTFSHGKYNDQWLGAYYNNISSALNSINTAIQVGKEQIEKGVNKNYTKNMIQVARIWRTFLMSEMSDCFGPIAIKAFQGSNPNFNSVKEVYYYILDELKEASHTIDPNITITDQNIKDEDLMFGFNFEYWQRLANSLRLRYAIRISDADQSSKAKEAFEDAAKGPLLVNNDQLFASPQQPGWDDATGIYSRSWYSLPLAATLNNLAVNLGGITTADQLNNSDIVPGSDKPEAIANIKPADYVGIKAFDYFPTATDNPVAGYWFDGLHQTIDPRLYKIFYIPGNSNGSSFPSVVGSTNTMGYLKDIQNDDPNTIVDSLDAKFTWNALQDGDAGKLGSYNELTQTSATGFIPLLAQEFRTSTKDRILFGPWETYFLLAEGKVKDGWNTNGVSAKEAYEKGIKASFDFWGVSQYANSYINSTDYNINGTSVKWDHTAEAGSSHTMTYTDIDDGTTHTVSIPYPTNELYKNGTVNNDHLTKIMTQKFIAQTPWLPRETWSDHRRLGLPFFENVVVEPSGNGLPALPGLASDYNTSSQKYLPQRMKYPSGLQNSNQEGYEEALNFLGGSGADKILTPLWWAQEAQ